MYKKIIKLFGNYEKEQIWLNMMSERGYHLQSYTFLKYTFLYDPEVQYKYCIELLNQKPNTQESLTYISFLEETGITVVTTYFSWIYLSQPAKLGDFSIHTDYASKIKHHKSILYFQAPLAIMNLFFGFYNLIIGIQFLSISLYLSIFSFIIGIIVSLGALREYKQIKFLEKEQSLSES